MKDTPTSPPPLTNFSKINFNIAGDELFSDTYPMKLVDDCVYEVYGKVSVCF